MNNNIHHYVKSCDSCQQIKASQQVPTGLLQPLPTLSAPWEQVSMDFITQLPVTKAGFDAIVIFIDTFSKMVHFVPTRTTATAPDTARIFFDNVFKLHSVWVRFPRLDRASTFREKCDVSKIRWRRSRTSSPTPQVEGGRRVSLV